MFRLKISKADKLFSLLIRSRAKWSCERCRVFYEPPTTALHCSHYIGRGNKAVRWDQDNAFSICYGCHRYLGSDPVAHRDFAIKKLGEEKHDALIRRAHIPTKVDQKLIVMGLEMSLKKMGVSWK